MNRASFAGGHLRLPANDHRQASMCMGFDLEGIIVWSIALVAPEIDGSTADQRLKRGYDANRLLVCCGEVKTVFDLGDLSVGVMVVTVMRMCGMGQDIEQARSDKGQAQKDTHYAARNAGPILSLADPDH